MAKRFGPLSVLTEAGAVEMLFNEGGPDAGDADDVQPCLQLLYVDAEPSEVRWSYDALPGGASYRPGGWNTAVIEVQGDHARFFLNDVPLWKGLLSPGANRSGRAGLRQGWINTTEVDNVRVEPLGANPVPRAR